ncbi:MAG: inverse autotransporter beta domain-containing protein [Desulfomonile tiedjei]|nr:inverse autotransporter beta domain-containing protein [Desulfomonile tiedjei]
MICSTNILNKRLLLLLVILASYIHGAGGISCAYQLGPSHSSTDRDKSFLSSLVPLPPQVSRSKEKSPEHYIDPALNHGLKLVLPQTIRQGLRFDAGYDKWEGLPTMQADYFLPVKGWTDKSVFFSPRISLNGTKESYSIGAGFRNLITSEMLVGFHAFHDWTRGRRTRGEFLKETGVGLEFTALPGYNSDITLSVNAYFPTNEKLTFTNDGEKLIREKFSSGADARLKLLLPPVVNFLDMKVDAQVHSYRGERTDLTGYNAGLSVNTRDGMLRGSVERGRDAFRGEYYKVEGNVTLAFDWVDLLKGENPFSAPYKPSATRFSRKIRDSLYDRAVRKHDLPTDRTESRITLAANVVDDTVSFNGGFPELPNTRITVQTSQSPWQDTEEVVTDSSGRYSGSLTLPPGQYRMRLVHKPSGRASAIKTIVIAGTNKE